MRTKESLEYKDSYIVIRYITVLLIIDTVHYLQNFFFLNTIGS